MLSAVILSAATFQDSLASDETLHVNDATIVMPVRSARVMAGYATLMNHSQSTQTLVSVSSDVFKRVEMHKSVIENDVAKMRKQPELTIPSHGELKLEQGGLHFMLMQPARQLNAGDKVTLVFNFDNGKKQSIEFNVVPLTHQSGDHAATHKSESNNHDYHNSDWKADHGNHGTDKTTRE